MKFGQQLEEAAIPEWRAKYLDYKQGKKRIKAVARAIRNADRSPNVARKPFNTDSLRDGPVLRFLSREQGDGPVSLPSSTVVVQSGKGNEEDRSPRTKARQIVNERSPLRGGRPEERRLTRYGSIVGSPASNVQESNELRQTRSNAQASSLELPAPAMGSRVSPHQSMRDSGELSPTSPASPDSTTSPPPPLHRHHDESSAPATRETAAKDPTDPQPAHVARPQTYDAANSPGGMPRPRRANSEAFAHPTSRIKPMIKRLFSASEGGKSGRKDRWRTDENLELEAFKELDLRQAEFFQFLDKERDKIETFYQNREKEAIERLDILRDQLHIMRNQRIEELTAAEEQRQAQQLEQDKQRQDDAEEMNGKAADAHLPKFSASAAKRRISSAVQHVDNAVDKVKPGHIGKTTKAMGLLASPILRPLDQSRQDYSRRPTTANVPYRFAKRRLKNALAEYYRGLELLKSYAMTNRTAFRKILKKYDKITQFARPNRYMTEKVNTAHFVNSDIIDQHMQTVEDLYARYFERGSRKVALNKLRARMPRPDDYTGSIWRQGVMATAGIVFGIEGLVYGGERLYSQDPLEVQQTSFLLQLYGGYFLMLLLTGLFVLDCRLFQKARVNYHFIFEFDSRHSLDWRQLSELVALFCLFLGLSLWVNFSRFGEGSMYIYWPVVLTGVSFLAMFLPLPTLYYRSRQWFAESHFRLLMAGIPPVEFRDFFLGDMYCSLTYPVGNIEMFFCLYARRWQNPPMCNSNHSRLFGFFQALPGIIRALQCLRRYRDTRNVFPHLVNCGKYMFTIMSQMSLSLFRVNHRHDLLAFFIFCSTINSIYCSIWDVVMDWSLGDFTAKHKFLRKTLAYKRLWMYYTAMVLDPILRFNWIFYVIYAHDIQHSTIVSFMVSMSEVFRRGMWTIFRVENEHCSNVGRFRASRDIPLPYDVGKEDEASGSQHSDHDNEAHESQHSPHIESQTPVQPTSTLDGSSTGVDVESGELTHSTSRRSRRASTQETPVTRALRRVGSTVAAAHSQDYERRKKPESTREQEQEEAEAEEDDDTSDEE